MANRVSQGCWKFTSLFMQINVQLCFYMTNGLYIIQYVPVSCKLSIQSWGHCAVLNRHPVVWKGCPCFGGWCMPHFSIFHPRLCGKSLDHLTRFFQWIPGEHIVWSTFSHPEMSSHCASGCTKPSGFFLRIFPVSIHVNRMWRVL